MQVQGFRRATRLGVAAWSLVALSATAAGAEVYVLCDFVSGRVVLEESADEDRHKLMGGPFPGERTATVWVEENCPERLCDLEGCGRERPPEPPSEGWLVVCDPGSGSVGMVEGPPPPGFLPLTGRDGTARGDTDREQIRVWTDENCPSWRCGGEGRCVVEEPADSRGPSTAGWVAGEVESVSLSQPTGAAETRSGDGGWVAGEVTSVTLGAPPAGAESAPEIAGRVEGPAGPGGPPAADLSPLVNNTKAAAGGCAFAAALSSLDHMANFDPEHPFYVANRDKLRRLAQRQRQTEQTVWRASSFLTSGNLKGARDLAQMAAGTAVSCQNQAVAVLLDGIDTAIKQKRTQQQLSRQQAASALLPGLVDLSRALSGAQGGSAPDPNALAASTAEAFGLKLSANAMDPCAFKYEYQNKWNTEPICTCGGYRFDASRFRCVR